MAIDVCSGKDVEGVGVEGVEKPADLFDSVQGIDDLNEEIIRGDGNDALRLEILRQYYACLNDLLKSP